MSSVRADAIQISQSFQGLDGLSNLALVDSNTLHAVSNHSRALKLLSIILVS